MIEQAISKIQELTKQAMEPRQVDINGRLHFDKELTPYEPPMNHTIEVRTITGLSDLIEANPSKREKANTFIQVVNPAIAMMYSLACNDWGKRQVDVSCKLPDFGHFPFGQYVDQERFIIGLQAFFRTDSEDLDYLLRVAGNIQAEQVQSSTDDGVSQKVSLRTGIVLAERTEIKRFVKLRPWRTFREIEQPESTFIFRLKNEKDELPTLMLVVADGETWQIEAVQSIKTFLAAKHPELTIVA